MNGVISALVWCAIQVTLLTCGAAVVYLAARRVHPRAGAAAAGGGLLMVIALTLLAASPWPRWSLPSGSEPVVSRAVVGTDVEAAVTSVDAPTVASPESSATAGPSSPVELRVESAPSFWSLLVDAINRPGGLEVAGGKALAKPQAAWGLWMMIWTFVVGGLIAAARLTWGIVSVRRLARSGRPIDDPRVTDVANELQDRLELVEAVTIRETDETVSPATVGWRRPVVLLPVSWRTWSDAELRAVIAHELAHIAGQDYATWFLARLAVVAHFYHPLVRWLANRLQLEQELAADMMAARLCGDSKRYLHSLAALALAMPPQRIAGPARTLFPSRSLLVRRVEMLRSNGIKRSRRDAARYATFVTVTLLALASAGLRGPGIDFAARATAADDFTAPATVDAPIRRIGLEIVPPDAVYVLSVRPAELAARDDTGQLIRMLGERTEPLADAKLSATDVAEVMVMSYGKQVIALPVGQPFGGQIEPTHLKIRFAVRFMTPASQTKFIESFANRQDLRKVDDEAAWESEACRLAVMDGTTIVIDHTSGKKLVDVAPLKNAARQWSGEWDTHSDRAIVGAANVEAIRTLVGDVRQIRALGAPATDTLYPLLTEVKWVVSSIHLDNTVQLWSVIDTDGEKSAKTVRDTLQALSVLLRNMASKHEQVLAERPNGAVVTPQSRFHMYLIAETGKLLEDAEFRVKGRHVDASLQTSIATADVAKMAMELMPAVENARQAARQATNINNLRQLQLAMLNYENIFKSLPLAAALPNMTNYVSLPPSDDSKPKEQFPHSWRVAILPYLGHQDLFHQYRFDEPWDSEANKKVLAKMPDVFRSPFDPDAKSTNTSYFVLTGPDTVFPSKNLQIKVTLPNSEDATLLVEPKPGGTRIAQISDGTSRTFSIVEAKRTVPWTKPEDIEYMVDKPVPKLGGWVPGEFLAALVDGSVHRVTADLDEATLRAWITRNGRENVKELPRPRGQ